MKKRKGKKAKYRILSPEQEREKKRKKTLRVPSREGGACCALRFKEGRGYNIDLTSRKKGKGKISSPPAPHVDHDAEQRRKRAIRYR